MRKTCLDPQVHTWRELGRCTFKVGPLSYTDVAVGLPGTSKMGQVLPTQATKPWALGCLSLCNSPEPSCNCTSDLQSGPYSSATLSQGPGSALTLVIADPGAVTLACTQSPTRMRSPIRGLTQGREGQIILTHNSVLTTEPVCPCLFTHSVRVPRLGVCKSQSWPKPPTTRSSHVPMGSRTLSRCSRCIASGSSCFLASWSQCSSEKLFMCTPTHTARPLLRCAQRT